VVADSLAAHDDGGPSKTAHEPAPSEKTPEVTTHAEPPVDGTTKNPATAGTEHAAKTDEHSPPKAATSAPQAAAHTPGESEHPAASPAPTKPPTASVAAKPEDVVTPKRISKIFAAMPARDAAKVLVQMDDADVHLILDALGEKQAAAILQNFPAERAATISKNAIRGTRAP
jgi:hypothetical protein